MRIGFDLDGVLADLHTAFVQAAIRLFPELDPAAIGSGDVGSSPPVDAEPATDETATPAGDVAMTRHQTDAVWNHLESVENFWETLDEHEPGAIKRLFALAEERRWEIIFITSRPHSAGVTVQRHVAQ